MKKYKNKIGELIWWIGIIMVLGIAASIGLGLVIVLIHAIFWKGDLTLLPALLFLIGSSLIFIGNKLKQNEK